MQSVNISHWICWMDHEHPWWCHFTAQEPFFIEYLTFYSICRKSSFNLLFNFNVDGLPYHYLHQLHVIYLRHMFSFFLKPSQCYKYSPENLKRCVPFCWACKNQILYKAPSKRRPLLSRLLIGFQFLLDVISQRVLAVTQKARQRQLRGQEVLVASQQSGSLSIAWMSAPLSVTFLSIWPYFIWQEASTAGKVWLH